ncbi:MAG: DUF1800 domain-containing protein [Chloroflexota bacterium]|nr:DUF1800 domain-containing protein [Chloroflexota bacterium]MDE3193309.1 DUF1800 domain-containing protein [Chloroflexota bacterium]
MSDSTDTTTHLPEQRADAEVERAVTSSPAPAARPAPARKRRPSLVDRRTVLSAAVAGGVGVGIARLLPWHRVVEVDPPQLTAQAVATRSTLDWVSPLGDEATRVAHLLRRTSFGYTAAELESAVADGYRRTVDRLVETPPAEPPALAGADDAAQKKPQNLGQLQQWWIDWMMKTPTPFAEHMTLFWHGHFTSDFRKVGLQDPYLYWQHRTWRRFFHSDLGTVLNEVTIDPAMLRYLDLGTSSASAPNENYSRELMELFTLGVGNYTEDDVKAAAKGLAGWRFPITQAMIDSQVEAVIKRTGKPPKVTPKPDTAKTGIYVPARAYRGAPFAYLGETKVWNTQTVLQKILDHEAVAPFITQKLLTDLVATDVDDSTVTRIADRFRQSRYDMKTLMSDVLTSEEFTSGKAYRALVKSPTEVMVSAAKALQAPQLSRLIAGSGEGMGQLLFDPPTVGGWPDNASWISSTSMLARINFVTSALAQMKTVPSAASAHAQFLDSTLSPQTLAYLNATTDDRRRWAAVLSCAEFQLK